MQPTCIEILENNPHALLASDLPMRVHFLVLAEAFSQFKIQFIIDPQFQHVTTATHEMLHILGAFHEHTRGDRDDYIKINWNNIRAT